MSSHRAQFRVGQLVHHKRFDYRGVIVDVENGLRIAQQTPHRVALRDEFTQDIRADKTRGARKENVHISFFSVDGLPFAVKKISREPST